MSDYELTLFHDSYDVENGNYLYYLGTKNMMIQRGLLYSKLYNLSNFSIDRFFKMEKKEHDKDYTFYCAKDIGLVS